MGELQGYGSMLFSIIIPAKNEEKNIPRCLNALATLSFSRSEFEVIVVDNGSCDATVSIVRDHGFQVHLKPRLSLSGLRNFGASAAQGDILVFLDADCIPEQDWLANAALTLADREIGSTGSTPVAPANGTWVEKVWSSFRTRRKNRCYASWINSSNFFVRRELFFQVDGFNESVMTCEDVDICMRLNKLCRILFDPKIKVVHLGEPKTVRDFFLKEVWRGKGNISGIISHGFSRSEMLSLLLPVYYCLLPFGIAAAMGLAHGVTAGLLAFLYFLPALVFTVWVISQTQKYQYTMGYFTLFLVYANARVVALFVK